MKGGPIGGKKIIEKKWRIDEKKSKGRPFGLFRHCMLRGTVPFGSVPWANMYNLASSQNFVELSVELSWSLQVV